MGTVVCGDFEWDEAKAAENLRKHGVSFETAAIAMTDPMSVDFEDTLFPDRLVTVAFAPGGAILCVVTVRPHERVRIITARRATSHERRIYEQGD